jgi:predicted Zn-dependent peptidase
LQQVTRSGKYNPNIYTTRSLYNSYFGGGMNAIVFQEMREKRSLAYTAWASYQLPGKKDGYCMNTSYIATQNDKVIDAYDAFNDLFNNMPVAEQNFTLAKESLISNIRTSRVTKMSIIWNYLNNEKMGYKQDMRKVLFEELPSMTMQNVIDFNKKYIKNTPKTYMILGKEADMDFKALEKKYGKVQKLTLEDVFGY